MPVRKDSRDLNDMEWKCLLEAMQVVKEDTSSDGWAEWELFHQTFGEHMENGVPKLEYLPWHRAYIHEFEKRLRDVNDSIALPYWNWSERGRIPKQIRTEDWMGISRRRIKIATPKGRATRSLLETDNFLDMNQESWDLHARVHGWVGGDMGSASTSANDPIFFLHHAQVDRLWALWQEQHPEQAFVIPDIDMDEMLNGFMDISIADVMNSADLDVSYAEPED